MTTLRDLVALLPSEEQEFPYCSAIDLLEDFDGDPDQAVSQPYVIIDYCAHRPETYLHQFSSLEAMHKYLTGPAGLANPFTTVAYCFSNGDLMMYEAYYHSDNGVRMLFDKVAQLDSNDPIADVRGFEIEWK